MAAASEAESQASLGRQLLRLIGWRRRWPHGGAPTSSE